MYVNVSTWLKNYVRTAPATAVIVAICVIAWVITAIQSQSIQASFFNSSLADAWTLWGPYIDTETWRLSAVMTSLFMHMTATHLVVNMLLLVFVGREIERFLGTGRYVAVYLAGGLASSASVLALSFDSATIGASGAIYALLVILVAVYRARGLSLRAPIFFVAVNLAYTVADSFMAHEVSLWGHIGGLVGGLVMLPFAWRRDRAGWGAGLVVLLAATTIALSIHPSWG